LSPTPLPTSVSEAEIGTLAGCVRLKIFANGKFQNLTKVAIKISFFRVFRLVRSIESRIHIVNSSIRSNFFRPTSSGGPTLRAPGECFSGRPSSGARKCTLVKWPFGAPELGRPQGACSYLPNAGQYSLVMRAGGASPGGDRRGEHSWSFPSWSNRGVAARNGRAAT